MTISIYSLAAFVFIVIAIEHFLAGKRKSESVIFTSPSSGINTWHAVFNQSSNADLELARFCSVAHAAAIVAATSSTGWFPGSQLPMLACLLFLLGLFFSVTPLGRLSLNHQRSANLIADALKTPALISTVAIPLPITRGAGWLSIRIPLYLFALGVSALFLAAITSFKAECQPGGVGIKENSIVVCAPAAQTTPIK